MNLLPSFARLTLGLTSPQFTRSVSTTSLLYIRTTPCLLAEPLKKKKRMDPAIIKAREDRKKKKIEKQIRRLEKNSRQLKPIEECEIPLEITDNKGFHQRTDVEISAELQEKRILIEKKWAKYMRNEHLADMQMIDRIMYSQQRALDQLRLESEELYQEAIQPDFTLLPFKSEGPDNTPPIKDYEAPDGDYVDVSKVW
ncbi:large ribosomal subunit protein mL40 [Atheta coriaria]|uniref:large ribosomal subunit protein mL40 n=1 Tax=Dalotia coriaria TaxID=877792 RepID=UPI0031F472BF